jgi:hypothetical protein
MTLNDQARAIQSRGDFVCFVRALLQDLDRDPGQWENLDLRSYLDALAAWVEDMDGYYQNKGEPVPEQPSWKVLGNILLAAKFYE